MTTPSKFSDALRKKFPGPKGRRQVAALLGIDADLINGAVPPASSGKDDPLMAMRSEIEEALSGLENEQLVSRIIAIMDKHAEAHAGHADDDETEGERFRAFLKARGGLSDEDINRAVQIVCGAADYSPENVFQAGLRGSQIAGDAEIMRDITRLCFSRISREPDFVDRRPSPVKVGMDSAGAAELHRMFPGIERIQLG